MVEQLNTHHTNNYHYTSCFKLRGWNDGYIYTSCRNNNSVILLDKGVGYAVRKLNVQVAIAAGGGVGAFIMATLAYKE